MTSSIWLPGYSGSKDTLISYQAVFYWGHHRSSRPLYNTQSVTLGTGQMWGKLSRISFNFSHYYCYYYYCLFVTVKWLWQPLTFIFQLSHITITVKQPDGHICISATFCWNITSLKCSAIYSKTIYGIEESKCRGLDSKYHSE